MPANVFGSTRPEASAYGATISTTHDGGGPEYFGSGTTAETSDTRRVRWGKLLIQQGGQLLKSDTLRQIKVKLLQRL
jgi:hypothetical protein